MTINPFEFRTVPSMQVAWGGAHRLGGILSGRFQARKALLITDAGLIKAGLIKPIADALAASGLTSRSSTRSLLIRQSISLPTASSPQGRSASISSSVLARELIARYRQAHGCPSGLRPDACRHVRDRQRKGITPAARAGADHGRYRFGSHKHLDHHHGRNHQDGVVSPQLYADFVLLDAELTVGLPQLHTAATGIDAMVHAIEAYTSKHKKNPLSDALAREALRLLGASLIAACRNGADRKPVSMLLGATLAGQAFANSPVAAVTRSLIRWAAIITCHTGFPMP